jgi:RNA polymerase sigma factor (sigma-70 family)
MPRSQPSAIREFLRSQRADADALSLPDRELLDRFARRRDEGAFKILLGRHGPLVWRACQRVLRQAADAEDVFQATFLVLARRAGVLKSPDAVGPWLYGVAHRLARETRRRALRQQARAAHGRPGAAPDPLAEVSGRELVAILDEELANLSARYRAPLLLCLVEGKSTEEVARQLGYSPRTVQRRLQRARELLHRRLGRRGFVLSAAALSALLLHDTASAGMPALLAVRTLQAASSAASGQPLAAGLVSAQAVTLAQGALKAMLWTKLKLTLAVVVLMCGLVAGGLAQTGLGGAGQPPNTKGPAVPQEAPPPQYVDVARYPNFVEGTAGKRLKGLLDRHKIPWTTPAAVWRSFVVSVPADQAERARDLIAKAITGEGLGVTLIEPPAPQVAHSSLTFSRGPVIDCTTLVTVNRGQQQFGRQVQLVGFSPDGKSVFAQTEYDCRIWAAATGEPITPPLRPGFGAQSAAFRSDGKALLLAGYGCMQLYDAVTGKPCHDLANPNVFPRLPRSKNGAYFHAKAAAFSPVGTLLAVSDDSSSTAMVFQAIRGHMLGQCDPIRKGRVRLVAIASRRSDADDQEFVAAVSCLRDDAKGEVRLFWAASGEHMATLPHDRDVYALAFSPDGRRLLTVSGGVKTGGKRDEGIIRVWDTQTGKQVGGPWENLGWLDQIAFRPDGKEVLALVLGKGFPWVARKAVTWDVASGKVRHEFAPPEPASVRAAVWSPDGKRVFTGGGTGAVKGPRGALRVWDAETGRPLCYPVEHAEVIEGLAVAPDGNRVVTACFDGKARLWVIEQGGRAREKDERPSKEETKDSPPQKKLVNALRQRGFEVTVEAGIMGEIELVVKGSAKTTDDDLKLLNDVPNLKALDLGNSQVTDAGLRHLAKSKGLVDLRLGDSRKITDAGLKEIAPLTSLEQLHLTNTGITEGGLRQLAGMKKLTYLCVGDYPIRAGGVAHLAKLSNLKCLFLQRCQLTDEDLLALRTLTNLTQLHVDGNDRLTPAGIARLQKVLPNLRVLAGGKEYPQTK